MSVKYKQSTGDYVKKIDIKTGQVMAEFDTKNKRYSGLISELHEFTENGGVIEPQFTPDELDAKEAEESELKKTEYQRLRKAEYPEIVPQPSDVRKSIGPEDEVVLCYPVPFRVEECQNDIELTGCFLESCVGHRQGNLGSCSFLQAPHLRRFNA